MKEKITLNQIKNKTGFHAPDVFFEENKAKILSQIIFEQPKKKSSFGWMKIAVSFVIILSAFLIFQQFQTQNTNQTSNQIEAYLASNEATLYLLMENANDLNLDDYADEAINQMSDEELDELYTFDPLELMN